MDIRMVTSVSTPPFSFSRSSLRTASCVTVLALSMLAGCKSAEDKALDQAKAQATATGQAQEVLSTDKNGNLVTTIVQPAIQGQPTQQIATTTVPQPPTAPRYASPVVIAAPQQTLTPGAAPQGAMTAMTPAPDNNAPGNAMTAAPNNAMTASPNGPTTTSGAPVYAPEITVPAGTNLAIRINQHISVKTTPAGSSFSGEVAEAVVDPNNNVLLPRGTPVHGVVDASHRRGHFKGASILELRLTSMSINGQVYNVSTRDLVRTKKGKGKRSAAFIGGGAGLGMLIGGVASGGVGLLAGGLAGGAGGTALAGLTGNRDIDIPAESIQRFKLSDDLTFAK